MVVGFGWFVKRISLHQKIGTEEVGKKEEWKEKKTVKEESKRNEL